ncbi:hypothetical protein JQ506_04120 [Shinella sp. PSBB067]|uniref:hypothetical protein n=1 Tax=Shinella sp. PSBB067 TaxID=2715959 RepID=UPI00193B42F3|nr:hypothetical protein [Shinella sp. PSBB067]QRI66100.1 hypothetical protein JQ506_04120 [Shinella sp. PSBB067]
MTVKEAAFSPVFQNRHSHSADSLPIRRQMKSVLFDITARQPGAKGMAKRRAIKLL